jgi:hypothetical protein
MLNQTKQDQDQDQEFSTTITYGYRISPEGLQAKLEELWGIDHDCKISVRRLDLLLLTENPIQSC